MERFKEVAPGTYRHSINVGQLCESIGKEIGVDHDSLLIAGTLHDIGKCFNPLWFSENQEPNKNPHDDVDPIVSYQYISRHVGDTVLKLTQMGVPHNIIKIVSEHHGDTIIQSIYNKAKSRYNGDAIEDHYRYKSIKPSSVESCILMISDSTEATCRSLFSNNKLDDVKSTIDKIINNLMDDEQLDVLTIGDVRVIKSILYKEMDGFFHKRVDYEEN